MPITATDIEFRQSGASNLGGTISGSAVSGALNGLFDYVTGAESAAGDTEYRCVYAMNNHGSLTLYGAKVWISVNTPAAGTAAQIGLGAAAIGGTESTTANEGTAPAGVTFYDAATEGASLSIGDLGPGQYKAVWIKRTVTAGAAAYNSDGMTVTVKGDSGA
jgi:hypothetical protein